MPKTDARGSRHHTKGSHRSLATCKVCCAKKHVKKFPWLKFLRLLLSVAWSVEAEGLHHEMLDGVSRIHVHL